MRTELTYAVDTMNRYQGDYEMAHAHVDAYHSHGGLSDRYYTNVVNFMYDIHQINAGGGTYLSRKTYRRIIKAIRRKMPRVHTEVSNWRLTYVCALRDVALGREQGKFDWARLDLHTARAIREKYL